MKVAIYIEPLKTFTSGMPHRGMIKELVKIRCDVKFELFFRHGGPVFFIDFIEDLIKNSNVSVSMLNQNASISNFLALIRYKNHCLIKNSNADIFLNIDANYLGSNNKPQIITVHDLSSVRGSRFSSLNFLNRLARKFIISNGIKNANKIISISKFTKEDILDYYDNKKDIDIIYNGISNNWFNENKTYGSNKKSYWIWYGGFNKRKNLDKLLAGYYKFLSNKDHYNKPDLILVGNKFGRYYEYIKSIIISNEILSSKVQIQSSKDERDLIKLVQGSEGLVFPSLYEGFGLPIVESLACGKNVLTSNNSSMKEISSSFGVLVNPNDINSISEGLEKLLELNSNKIELETYAKKFTYSKCAQAYSNLLNKVYDEYHKK